MQSMTGCGVGLVQRDGWEVTAELKTVNHRFLDLSMRLPRNIAFLEPAVREETSKGLKPSLRAGDSGERVKSWFCQSVKSGSAKTLPSSFTRFCHSANDVPLKTSLPSVRHQRLPFHSIFAFSPYVPLYLLKASPFVQMTMLRSAVSERCSSGLVTAICPARESTRMLFLTMLLRP